MTRLIIKLVGKANTNYRFMQSDPWWSFAMAFNVFLVFFCNVDPVYFRTYWWVYCIVCFGGPLIPAVVLISIHDDSRGPVFGDATVSESPKCSTTTVELTAAALVLDRFKMGPCSSLCLLYSHLGVHPAFHFDLYRCRLSRLSSSEYPTQCRFYRSRQECTRGICPG